MSEMRLRPRGGAQDQIAYAAGRFENNSFIINQPLGAGPIGSLLHCPGSKYSVELAPDGSGSSRLDGEFLTSPKGTGKGFYIRDRESGEVWSPFFGPSCRDSDRYEVAYKPGEATIYSLKNKIGCELTIAVVPHLQCEVWRIRIENRSARERSLEFTTYAEPCIDSALETKYIGAEKAIIMRPPLDTLESDKYQRNKRDYVFYQSSTLQPSRFQTERSDFTGEDGNIRQPAHVTNEDSEGADGIAVRAIASISVDIDLPLEGEADFGYVFGVAENTEQAIESIRSLGDIVAMDAALDHMRSTWNQCLGAFRVSSQDSVLDALVNIWIPYEITASAMRITGASAALDPSRAADGLKCAMALCAGRPDFAHDEIISFCGRLNLRGISCSATGSLMTIPQNDLIWLAAATARYVAETGDIAFLNNKLRLGDGLEITLREHCERAIRMGVNNGTPSQLVAETARLWSYIAECPEEYVCYADEVSNRRTQERSDVSEQRNLPRKIEYLQSACPTLSDSSVVEYLENRSEVGSSESAVLSELYVAITEGILGITPSYEGLIVEPSVPSSWVEYAVNRRFRGDIYGVSVSRSATSGGKACSMVVDGEPMLGKMAPRFGDGREHEVSVIVR